MKRFLISFFALLLGISAVFTLQISLAQTFPNTNPPVSNAGPNFSGLNVTGNGSFTGPVEFGNAIKPKGAATTLGVMGKLNVSNGLDITGTANVSKALNVNQFFSVGADTMQVKLPATFDNVVNLNSNVNVKGDLSFPGKVAISGSLTAVGDVNFPNGAKIGNAGTPNTGTLDIVLPATFTKNVTIGDAYVSTLHAKTAGQPITIADKLKVSSDLEVSGNQTVSNGKITVKNIDVATDLNVTGKVNIQNIYPKTAGQAVNVNGPFSVAAENLTTLQAVDIKGEIKNSSGGIVKVTSGLHVFDTANFQKAVGFSENINLMKNIVPTDKVLEVDGKIKINKFDPNDANEYRTLQIGQAFFEEKNYDLNLTVNPLELLDPNGKPTGVISPGTGEFIVNAPTYVNDSFAADKIGNFKLAEASFNLNAKNWGFSAYVNGFHTLKTPNCDSGYIVISCNGGFYENNADTKSSKKLDYLGSKMTSVPNGEQSCSAYVRKNEDLTMNVTFQVQAMCFNPSL